MKKKQMPKAKAISWYGSARQMASEWGVSHTSVNKLPDPLPLHWSAAVQADMDSEKKK